MKRHLPGTRRTPTGRAADGFTLIELLTALAIATIAVLALAGGLAAALRVAGLQKVRAQGNELATQAIEDLQRLDYDHLGVCAPATSPPAGLSDATYLANCSAPTFEEPCTPTAGQVPDTSYACTRLGVTYQVRRYVGWGDSNHTSKRLAVLVDWSDQAGTHQVAQQSSLRSPDQGSVVGLSPPAFSASSVLVDGAAASSGNPVRLVDGVVQGAVTFQATTTGIPDSVFVSFLVRGDTGAVASTLQLTQTGSGTWSVTLPAGSNQFLFGSGTQYVTFIAVRSADGKVNSQPSAQIVTFVTCLPGGTGCTPGANTPGLTGVTASPTAPQTDAAGLLCGDVTVSATASNLTAADSVTASFQTLAGPYTIALSSSDGSAWSAVIPASANYRFPSGSQPIYVSAAQDYAPGAVPPEYGSTAAVATSPLTFGGGCP